MEILTVSVICASLMVALKAYRAASNQRRIRAGFNREAAKLFKAHNQSRYHEMKGWRR